MVEFIFKAIPCLIKELVILKCLMTMETLLTGGIIKIKIKSEMNL